MFLLEDDTPKVLAITKGSDRSNSAMSLHGISTTKKWKIFTIR